VTGAQINFGYLTPYLTYVCIVIFPGDEHEDMGSIGCLPDARNMYDPRKKDRKKDR